MKSPPRIGTTGELTCTVGLEHNISFATDGMPAVRSTPSLIGLIERTARESWESFLQPDERSVSVEIELRPLAPTPLGQRVTCLVRVIQAEGKQVTFQVEAREAHELIARGVHTRAVIHVGSFDRPVPRKRE